ncbi:cell division protein FtsB [Saccharospirillum sp. MSK14-1]|uniref:cell division protein FtsB n=1 Tax=Saccharospirillum sp. MSK14-1 TaxID=1897632 RepID=UPI000D345D51|nr:cell division protein FtsB [Saccharospirillum sp. MSK14-1]PTY37166.1 cell division protein FtsB [Saccharospirillum sp. MSK14-1]
MRWLQLGLLFLLVVLQYRLWLGENSWPEVHRLDTEIATRQAEIDRQQSRNDVLEARVDDLKSGLDAVEELARNNLGLLKPGELFYVIPAEEADR